MEARGRPRSAPVLHTPEDVAREEWIAMRVAAATGLHLTRPGDAFTACDWHGYHPVDDGAGPTCVPVLVLECKTRYRTAHYRDFLLSAAKVQALGDEAAWYGAEAWWVVHLADEHDALLALRLTPAVVRRARPQPFARTTPRASGLHGRHDREPVHVFPRAWFAPLPG